ncbi:hypothetical protein SAMD00019534_098220 [Acytostelium subglobosum LB1]|uniref:hypothetical protein n=1 Tax=Acytostelium subglobosum LB1 TaxID=1410327 RepID=UPI000644A7B8|nr:hypothetical protein SAMD00019534_098220 [Acytostelium subglobosum LB1]GAM26647.1 hypothetical protein SAMD00019534_098220 [Acytostelium subglobosum LB1]|eukprot:XP_012750308.1 hypothetical protein SAMD00019534_098220 [Acytostelium subglobosum LB1]
MSKISSTQSDNHSTLLFLPPHFESMPPIQPLTTTLIILLLVPMSLKEDILSSLCKPKPKLPVLQEEVVAKRIFRSLESDIESKYPNSKIPQSILTPFSAINGLSMQNKFACSRTETIDKMSKTLFEKHLIFVRSPPSSGKTSLLVLFAHRYRADCDVVSISFLGIKHDNFESKWVQDTGKTFADWISSTSKPTLLLIDEAQIAFNIQSQPTEFWALLKDLCTFGPNQDAKPPLYVVVMAAYGEHFDVKTECSTPIGFEGMKFGMEDMKLKEGELQEMTDKRNKFTSSGFRLTKNTCDRIWSSTGGHVGLVTQFIWTLYDQFKDLADDNDVLSFILGGRFMGAMAANRAASFQNLSQGQLLFLDQFDAHERIFKQHAPVNIVTPLIKHGILVVLNDTHLSFSSPIFRALYFQFRVSPTTRGHTDLSFDDFIVETISHFDRDTLLNTKGKGTDGKPLESTWQGEFYRCAVAVLPPDVYISQNVGQLFGIDCYLDFYVDDGHKWGIELLCEGKGIQEHAGRFKTGGKYKEFTNKRATIDFRISDVRPTQKTKSTSSLWLVTYDEDMTQLRISNSTGLSKTITTKSRGASSIRFNEAK